jgi:hypothetical protein
LSAGKEGRRVCLIILGLFLLSVFAPPLTAQTLPDLRSFHPQPGPLDFLAHKKGIGLVSRWFENCSLASSDISIASRGLHPASSAALPKPQGSSWGFYGLCPARPSAPESNFQHLNPSNTCPWSNSFEWITGCGMSQVYRLPQARDGILLPSFYSVPAIRAPRQAERFHWRPALLQSLEFLLFEHGFRLAMDPYARYLLMHKPFWHDYLSSSNHFVMSRWGDGDDFLVNYIGHPLEGSVSGNIQIQNDPNGRALKFGKSAAYWKSRLRAMTWAAVYSAYFEIGPILSEAAIGNEGGYTYVPGCGLYPCKEPGHFKPPTNNTGWVDFTVTPLVGMGWIVLEDSIEAGLVDRLAKDDPALGFKILRAALSPSRSMANMLAGKHPWYRYSNERLERSGALVPTHGERQPWNGGYRWNFGFHYSNLDIPASWPGCSACRVNISGAGLGFGYRLTPLFALDSEINYFPGSGGVQGKGPIQEALLGIKVGRPFHSWGVFGVLRPGIIHYDNAQITQGLEDYGSVTRFALDAGGVIEYYPSRHSAIRFALGTTLVRYATGQPDPRQPPVSVLANDYVVTQGSFHFSTGYTFRF